MKMILNEDLEYVWNALSLEEKGKLTNSTILLTGCGGFLGQFYLAFFEKSGFHSYQVYSNSCTNQL